MEPNYKFYLTSEEAWLAFLESCSHAKKSIYLDQYIFKDINKGTIVEDLSKLFIKKAKEGVEIKMIIDFQASWSSVIHPLVNEMQEAGVKIHFFIASQYKFKNRFKKIFRHFWRDHKKLLIVDDKVGFIGGVILEERARYWRDTVVKFEGELVPRLSSSFEKLWKSLNEKSIYRVAPPETAYKFGLLESGPERRDRYILNVFLNKIRNAKKSILFTTPYWNPPAAISRAIRKARKQGVEVKVILPQASDNWLVDKVSQSFYHSLLESGVQIFLFDTGKDSISNLHAKTLSVDEEWATVGSTNMDRLSLLHNYELNVYSTDPGFVAEVMMHFGTDLELSKRLDLKTWEQRPWYSKFFEKLLLPLRIIA
jgi:cardiolipin synthase A/B